MKKLLLLFLFPVSALAAGDFRTTAEILATHTEIDTHCATAVFANAIAESAQIRGDTINDYTPEEDIQAWVYDVMQSPEVLGEVLACPEIADADENETIHFMPIKYEFPGGREIVIKYETQPKVLEQHFMLANKTELPTDDPNPEIRSDDPHATWVYTDPAWYAIMVTRPGALGQFVGKDKNNTVSMQYIYDNYSSLYPADSDGVCSTRTGIGAKVNDAMVHKVMREHTAKHDDDKNNYYIAGDADMRWVSVAEIVAEIAITIVTWGGSAVASGAIKGARAAKIMAKTAKNIKTLTKIDHVKDYIRGSVRVARATREVENIAKAEKSLKNIAKLEKSLAKATRGTKKYERIAKQLETARKAHVDNLAKLGREGQALSSVTDLDKLTDMSKAATKEIKETEKAMQELAKTDKNVAEYVRQFDALKDVSKYAKNLRAFRKARTGNMLSRTWQGLKNAKTSLKAAHGGTKTLDKAAKVARSGAKTGRVRDWLFHSSMRNLGRVARVTEDVAALSFVLGLVGDFYDWTNVETNEFTNGINMKPYLLLSADDIEGQDNVVNYGMWLMWSGDTTSSADDDAAYLQAMDFAQKFHQDLIETQEEDSRYACDVDIYVVRPVIRNPDTDHQQLYWLIMNEEPWSTNAAASAR